MLNFNFGKTLVIGMELHFLKVIKSWINDNKNYTHTHVLYILLYTHHRGHVIIRWGHVTTDDVTWYHMTTTGDVTWPTSGGTLPRVRAPSHRNSNSLLSVQSSFLCRAVYRSPTVRGTPIRRTSPARPDRAVTHSASLRWTLISSTKSRGRPWCPVRGAVGG